MIEMAKPCDISEVSALYDSLNDSLEQTINYPCWKKGLYPTYQTAEDGINSNTMFVLRKNNRIAGTVILNHHQPSQYVRLTWGVDPPPEKIITVNTLAVHPSFFRQSVAEDLLSFADEFCLKNKMQTIRLDVTVQNSPAIRLYEKSGYTLVGDVDLELGIKGLELFHCYEKVLSY